MDSRYVTFSLPETTKGRSESQMAFAAPFLQMATHDLFSRTNWRKSTGRKIRDNESRKAIIFPP